MQGYIHQKKAKQYYKEHKMHIIFNAPYHSEFNPIENVLDNFKKLNLIEIKINHTKI